MRKLQARFLICILGAFLFLFQCYAQKEELVWSHELKLEKLPNELDSHWRGLGEGNSYIEGSSLIIDTNYEGAKSSYVWRIDGDLQNPYWDANHPTTVEFRMKVRNLQPGKLYAAHVVFSDSERNYNFSLENENWATYRVLINNGRADLYKDGNISPDQTSYGNPLPDDARSNHFYFGDGGDEIGGQTEWEFIRWTNDGAFAPGEKKD